jgi:hypothetical protein
MTFFVMTFVMVMLTISLFAAIWNHDKDKAILSFVGALGWLSAILQLLQR